MKRLLVLAALFCAVVTLLAGCSGNAVDRTLGRRPWPSLPETELRRRDSTARGKIRAYHPRLEDWAVWKIDDQGLKRFVNFAFDAFDAQGDNGVFVLVMVHGSMEAIDLTSTYHAIYKISGVIWTDTGGDERVSNVSPWDYPPSSGAVQASGRAVVDAQRILAENPFKHAPVDLVPGMHGCAAGSEN